MCSFLVRSISGASSNDKLSGVSASELASPSLKGAAVQQKKPVEKDTKASRHQSGIKIFKSKRG